MQAGQTGGLDSLFINKGFVYVYVLRPKTGVNNQQGIGLRRTLLSRWEVREGRPKICVTMNNVLDVFSGFVYGRAVS